MKSIIVRIVLVVLLPLVSLCPADEPAKRTGIDLFQDEWTGSEVVVTGNTAHKGGAVRVFQAFFKADVGRFEQNRAVEGGALSLREATGVVLEGFFEYNSARTGGALFNDESKIVLNDSIFSKNTAEKDGNGGGAIFNRQGTVVLHNGELIDNRATAPDPAMSDPADSTQGGGGAVANVQGSVIATDTDFEKNQADRGGAVSNFQGTVVADHATFDSNIALKANGGAIDNFQGTLILKDCDFLDNTAPNGLGAAIRLFQAQTFIEVHDDFRSLFSGNLDQTGTNSIHIESGGNLQIGIAKDAVLDMRDPISARNDHGIITVTKKGKGVWKLGGVNRFTGPADVRIDEGTLYLYRDGEVGNANPNDLTAVVRGGQIFLEDENSTLTFGKGGLELGGGNFIQAGKIVFGNKSSIHFSPRPNQEDEPDTLRLKGNVVFDGPVLRLHCYNKNHCETIRIDGEAVSVKFECIEISDAKPGTYAVLRAEQGVKSIAPRGICVRAPGFKANYEIVDDNKQLNITLTEEKPVAQAIERVVKERRRGKR